MITFHQICFIYPNGSTIQAKMNANEKKTTRQKELNDNSINYTDLKIEYSRRKSGKQEVSVNATSNKHVVVAFLSLTVPVFLYAHSSSILNTFIQRIVDNNNGFYIENY